MIVVAEAPPVIVLVAERTCFKSMTVESLAATVVVVAKFVPAKPNVNVPDAEAVLVTTMLVTTVVVALGTV